MVVTRRGYRTAADLAAVGVLLRDAWAARPRFNAWTFARFDIWAQWRLADAALREERRWQDDIALWEEGGAPVAAALIGESPDDGVLVLEPRALALVPELLAWLEERHEGRDRPLLVEANDSSGGLGAELARSGYVVVDGHYIPREKRLRPPEPPVDVPPGYTLATLSEVDPVAYLDASRAVFGRGGLPDAYAFLARAPSAAPGAGVVALDADGTVVSFADVWVDARLGVAEFEPVGTRAEHRGRGLGSAVMAEVENRLRRRRVGLATVHSWNTADEANRLYDRLGYERVDAQRNWQRLPVGRRG